MTVGDCKPKAALWARVSTAKEMQGRALEQQLERLREEAARRGYEVVREYAHRGLSAYRTTEGLDGALDGVIADAAALGFSALFVTRIDRLSRGGSLYTLAAIQRMADAGVQFVAIDEFLLGDPTDPVNEMVLSVLSAVAKMSSVQHGERVRLGQARARAEGKHLGRPRGAKDKRPRGGKSVG